MKNENVESYIPVLEKEYISIEPLEINKVNSLLVVVPAVATTTEFTTRESTGIVIPTRPPMFKFSPIPIL